jgi:hypothetical protein
VETDWRVCEVEFRSCMELANLCKVRKIEVVWTVVSRWKCGRDPRIAAETVSKGNDGGGCNSIEAKVTKGVHPRS